MHKITTGKNMNAAYFLQKQNITALLWKENVLTLIKSTVESLKSGRFWHLLK